MREYTHITGAILLFLTFAYLTNINNLIIGIFFAGWISVFPDIIDKLTGNHRGIGHSIIWLIPFALVGIFNLTIAIAMIIGFISHILLDLMTIHGCPVLYPILKTDFVCFNRRRRIKTATYQEKAAFVFLLFLLIPVILFISNIGTLGGEGAEQNVVFASSTDAKNSTEDVIKNNYNLNFQLNEGTNKKITVRKVNENETTIMVNDT
jgi:inner membrane protein